MLFYSKILYYRKIIGHFAGHVYCVCSEVKFSAFDPPASEEQRAADVQCIYNTAVGQDTDWKNDLEYILLKIIMISTTSTLTFSSFSYTLPNYGQSESKDATPTYTTGSVHRFTLKQNQLIHFILITKQLCSYLSCEHDGVAGFFLNVEIPRCNY